MKKYIINFIKISLLMLPIIWGTTLIYKLGVNVLFWDEFNVINFFKDIKENGISIYKFLEQHNEHRMFFPKIIFLLNMYISNYNSKILMYISIILISITYLIITKYILKNINNNIYAVIISSMIGFICFNLTQYENLFWGFQVAWFLIELCVVGSFYIFSCYMENKKFKYLILSVSLGIIASFSSMHGLWIWLVYICIIILFKLVNIKINNRDILFISITGIISFIIYFYNYNSPEGHKSASIFSKNGGLIAFFKHFFVEVGTVLESSYIKATFCFGIIICLLLLVTLIILIKENRIYYNIFPICLIIYGLLTDASIAAGRCGFGVGQALSSRYTTNTLLIYIGIILIFYREYRESKFLLKNYNIRNLSRIFIEGLCILLVFRNLYLIPTVYSIKDSRNIGRERLENYKEYSLEELNIIYPFNSIEQVEYYINFLKENNLNQFKN